MQKDENLVLTKEQVEIAELYKSVLKKLMITREYYTKYNFVDPLKIFSLCNKVHVKSDNNIQFLIQN